MSEPRGGTPKAIALTAETPQGRQVVQGFRPGGFTIGGVRHDSSVLVHPQGTVAWEVERLEQLTVETLDPLLEVEPAVEILLVGAGDRFAPAPPALRANLRARGVSLEAMDTKAACRTYNLLVAEDRRVAAALIALGES